MNEYLLLNDQSPIMDLALKQEQESKRDQSQLNSTFESFKRTTTQNHGDLTCIFQKYPVIETFTPADSGNILDELREPTHLRGFTTREPRDRRDSDAQPQDHPGIEFKRITEIDSADLEESKASSA